MKHKTVETFWLLKRYQHQLEEMLPCCTNAISLYRLQDIASEIGLSNEDLQVQRAIYQYCKLRLRRLPPLIGEPERLEERLDPAVLALYEKAITVSHKSLNRIFGKHAVRTADACVTLDKLSFARRNNHFGSDSVLLRPVLPGQNGSLIVSPSLLMDSLLFRFAFLFSLVE